MLAIDLKLGNTSLIVACCYRPPSANKEALFTLSTALTDIVHQKEIILLGDLNWNWLTDVSKDLKDYCDSVNLTQVINTPTRPNAKDVNKSTLIDLILINNPDKCTQIGIFSNDISDHCAVGMIRNCKLKKTEPRIVEKRHFKTFDQQAFIHDIFHFDWKKVCLIPDVELAWSYFKDSFMGILNKHAPLRKFKVQRERQYLVF